MLSIKQYVDISKALRKVLFSTMYRVKLIN